MRVGDAYFKPTSTGGALYGNDGADRDEYCVPCVVGCMSLVRNPLKHAPTTCV